MAIAATRCSVCSFDAGFPNVRYANRPEEREALEKRVEVAEVAAAARGTTRALNGLREALTRTNAVMNRRLTPLQLWVRSNNPIFRNFYNEIEEGRQAVEDRWNNQRASAENTINPSFYRELSIAALSLDGGGLTYYGPYTVTLRENIVAHKASVFEENPFYFNERHGVISGHEPPVGYRAAWDVRDQLGIAKLHSRVTPEMASDAEFATLIMAPDRDRAECDFIEVHIYAGVHREAIQRVSGPRPEDPVDKVFWDDVAYRLTQIGAEVEEL